MRLPKYRRRSYGLECQTTATTGDVYKRQLPDGRHFLADLMGLEVRDADTGAVLGHIADILTPPAHEVYVVRGGAHEYMIPAVDAFLAETNVEDGYIRVRLIEGMASDG